MAECETAGAVRSGRGKARQYARSGNGAATAAELRDEAECRGLTMHGAGVPDGCARGRAMNPRTRHDTARVAIRGMFRRNVDTARRGHSNHLTTEPSNFQTRSPKKPPCNRAAIMIEYAA